MTILANMLLRVVGIKVNTFGLYFETLFEYFYNKFVSIFYLYVLGGKKAIQSLIVAKTPYIVVGRPF